MAALEEQRPRRQGSKGNIGKAHASALAQGLGRAGFRFTSSGTPATREPGVEPPGCVVPLSTVLRQSRRRPPPDLTALPWLARDELTRRGRSCLGSAKLRLRLSAERILDGGDGEASSRPSPRLQPMEAADGQSAQSAQDAIVAAECDDNCREMQTTTKKRGGGSWGGGRRVSF